MYDLGDLYAEFNARFFNGELPILPSHTFTDENGEVRTSYGTLKWDGRLGKRTYGVYSYKDKTIRLSRKIAVDPIATRSVLLHEMVHKYLHTKGLDDGVQGHGANFIEKAMAINAICEEIGTEYRVHFQDQEVTEKAPSILPQLLDNPITLVPDLDIALKMKTVAKAAFDKKFIYRQ